MSKDDEICKASKAQLCSFWLLWFVPAEIDLDRTCNVWFKWVFNNRASRILAFLSLCM